MSTRATSVIVGMLLVVVALAGCAGEPTVPPIEQVEQSAAEPSSGEQAAVDPTPMGTSATAGDWTITVKEVERARSAGGADASSGKELVVITYDLKNGGPADQGTGPVDYSLADAGGAAYTVAQTSDATFIFNIPQPISTGETREIRIAYEVPEGSGPFVWTFAPFGAAAPAVLEVK